MQASRRDAGTLFRLPTAVPASIPQPVTPNPNHSYPPSTADTITAQPTKPLSGSLKP
ncbi:MAG: hypothetical protein Q4A85_02090 [Kingella sp. (in: b-proteobacteria)]|nr:hypothetical protein [Kingella sp. (in: b-proteobacteria)]